MTCPLTMRLLGLCILEELLWLCQRHDRNWVSKRQSLGNSKVCIIPNVPRWEITPLSKERYFQDPLGMYDIQYVLQTMHDEVTSCGISDYRNKKRKFTGNKIDEGIVNHGLIHGNIRNTLSRVISVS